MSRHAPTSVIARISALASTFTTSVIPHTRRPPPARILWPRPTSSALSSDTLSPQTRPSMLASTVSNSKLSFPAATVSLLCPLSVCLAYIKTGYSKQQGTVCRNAPTVSSFDAPTQLPAAIDAPSITKNGQQYSTYNGMRLFNENPYDPSLCAAACQAQTAFDKEHLVDSNGEYRPCNFFTSYILTQNDVPLGTYCAFYTQTWGAQYATNTGYYWESDVYRTICAASYSLTAQDSGIATSN